MPAEQFVEARGRREGVPVEVALQHVRAVMAPLRDAIDEDAFFDITVQLPREYDSLLARA